MAQTAGRIALTFDAEVAQWPCDPGNPGHILETLFRESVRATFFLQGRLVLSGPSFAREVAAAGHLIGNHSHSHERLTWISNERIRRSILQAQETIVGTTGRDPRPYFRCPYGAGGNSRRVLDIVEGLGYRHVSWDVDTADWIPGRKAAGVARAVVAGWTSFGDGARVLLHSWPDATAAALPSLIASLRELGAVFVGIDELA